MWQTPHQLPRAICTVLVLLLGAANGPAQATQQAASAAVAKSATLRECSANPVLASHGKKSPKSKRAPSAEPPPVCREVAGEAIELQEFLQAQARTQGWRIAESRASEDSWSFVRYFDADELNAYADTGALRGEVKFSSGKAAVNVRTTDIGGGFVRLQVSARFLGEGTSADTAMAQPATQWPVASSGLLEKELLTAIEKNYHPLH